MSEAIGLRERKKERTRQLIAETALRLFQERGIDAVTVDDVAREAEVSRKTGYNYFPNKEDLFYSGLELFEVELLDAIRARAAGESILGAFARFVTEPRGLLAAKDPSAADRLRELHRLVAESPALQARERYIYDRYTQALAGLIAEETGARTDEVTPWVAANAMLGVHRALVDDVRRKMLAGKAQRRIARELGAKAKEAVELLERELGQLGRTPRSGSTRTGGDRDREAP
jgi:AcrR family transcriptional regulator